MNTANFTQQDVINAQLNAKIDIQNTKIDAFIEEMREFKEEMREFKREKIKLKCAVLESTFKILLLPRWLGLAQWH